MSDPIAFRPRAVASTVPGGNRRQGDVFSITVTLGPFVVGSPPVWADVAAMILAECQREYEARAATP
jgi:hypothetical protein